MSILVLDFETSTQWDEDGRTDSSPYNANNFLVSSGYCNISDVGIGDVVYDFYNHSDLALDHRASPSRLQEALDKATLLVAHNAKFELNWLRAAGFKYDGPVWCTFIGEYVLARGRKDIELNLYDTSVRRGVTTKKSELVDGYFKKRIGFDRMPIEIVEEYGIADIQSCAEVYLQQVEDFTGKDAGLKPTLDLMNEFCVVLADMEWQGIAIDREALGEVKAEYLAEQEQLKERLNDTVGKVMGDTPINLSSPAQLSTLIYSRRVIDREAWLKTFNIGTDARGKPLRRPRMTQAEFNANVRRLTERVNRTKVKRCGTCSGRGKIDKYTKSGDLYKKLPACPSCGGEGVVYERLQGFAGLRQSPTSIQDVTANGFATDKTTLTMLAERVVNDSKAPAEARQFLTDIVRLNKVDTYLSSFVGGIDRNVRADNILHCNFNQCVTSTGRLSSSDPNFQNQPRGDTFPIKRVVVSRWNGGRILEADFAQLEFRVAGELSGDEQVKQDVESKFDVHRYTASILNSVSMDAVTSGQRQGAKSNTFKPLFGGTTGTVAEQAYYKAFAQKYSGVTEWHKRLLKEAVSYRVITIPTGRQYSFPHAKRQPWGGVTNATQIKNFPVQGLATADIVPCAVIRIWRKLKEAGFKSILINTVHDSVVLDIYPGELDAVAHLVHDCMVNVKDEMLRRYNYTMKLALEAELKEGPNWLDTQLVKNLAMAA